jgi:hypothetical protein
MIRIDIDCLYESKIENLERLARWLGIPIEENKNIYWYKYDLIYKILHKERELSCE